MIFRKKQGTVMTVVLAGVTLLLSMTACSMQQNAENTETVVSENMLAETVTTESQVTENQNETEAYRNETITEEPALQETEDMAGQEQDSKELQVTNPEPTTLNNSTVSISGQPIEYGDLQQITLNPDWEYADHSKINSGAAVLYPASEESGRKNIIIGVNAGHGTAGGSKVKTLCHPDGSAKTTGGSTAAGATEAAAVSGGMTFQDGTSESTVTLRMAQILRDKLLTNGYDVLMLRDGEDVQLDNVARTVICNNVADCHIALHWDSGDGKNYDKGCFYISVPEALKSMEPVASHWQQHDALGADLVEGLRSQGAAIYGKGHMSIDLTQTSYSTIPSVDMELGNGYSDHSDATLDTLAEGLVQGIQTYFGK